MTDLQQTVADAVTPSSSQGADSSQIPEQEQSANAVAPQETEQEEASGQADSQADASAQDSAVAETVDQTPSAPQLDGEPPVEPQPAEAPMPFEPETETPVVPDEVEENRTYYVIDGAPLLVRASEKPHKILGAVTLGSEGKDVSLAGRLVVSGADAFVTEAGFPVLGTTGAGQIPFEQDGKLVGLTPTEAGQVLTLVKDEATGALLPSWKPFELPPAAATPKSLFLAKDADQQIERLTQTTVTGWATPVEGKTYHNEFGFDEALGSLSLDASSPKTRVKVFFQATVQAGSPSGSVTASVLVDQGQGFETVAEQTFRPGPSVVYPFPVFVSGAPLLAPGAKLAVSLWHDSSAPLVVVGGPSTTLSLDQ